MTAFKSRRARLMFTIGVSFCFFVAEISVGFYTRSLALVADAFHYMNDLIAFIVALVALLISERKEPPSALSFGWQRAQLLGAFFNGVFLVALGISIFLQSVERFIALQHVENPQLVLAMGCTGLALNIISATVLHEHDHGHDHGRPDEYALQDGMSLFHAGFSSGDHAHTNHRHAITAPKSEGRDLGMLGALIHVIGDAINNVGVIIAALVIWRTNFEGRFYADPGVSMGIAILILVTSLPLMKNSGLILLQSVPRGVDIADVKHDLESIDGVDSVHELHIWRLNQQKVIASAHIVMSEPSMDRFTDTAKTMIQCLHSYGIHSATLQPETQPETNASTMSLAQTVASGLRRRVPSPACQNACGIPCAELTCCTPSTEELLLPSTES